MEGREKEDRFAAGASFFLLPRSPRFACAPANIIEFNHDFLVPQL